MEEGVNAPAKEESIGEQSYNRFSRRKKLTTTPEPFDNIEYTTPQPWNEDSNKTSYENSRLNRKCGKSCRGNFRRPTTAPEPDNYPPPFTTVKPIKHQTQVTQLKNVYEQDNVDASPTIGVKSEYEAQIGKQEAPQQQINNSPSIVSKEQDVQQVATISKNTSELPWETAFAMLENAVQSKNTLSGQTKLQAGKDTENSAIDNGNDNNNQAQSFNEFPNSHRPQTPPTVRLAKQHEMLRPNDFAGYSRVNPQPGSGKPQQTSSHEPGKGVGGYVYTKPGTSYARPTTPRPKPQTTPSLGLSSYMYPNPLMTYFYSTTMKPVMQESSSFLPMLLKKKQEVLESTPIIGPAMTTVRNIIHFVTQPDRLSYNTLKYQIPYQYPTTSNPMNLRTTYAPYTNFPPYPSRSTVHKQTSAVNSGFKLKAKPRKNQKVFEENRTEETSSGLDSITPRPVSSPRPFKKHTQVPLFFESTKVPLNLYDTATTLKVDASSHHLHKSPSGGKHSSRGSSSVRKARTRTYRKRCQHMTCRSARQNAIRTEDLTLYVPVSSKVSVWGPKVRTKRQDSEAEGYVYPRPMLSTTTTGLPVSTGVTTPKLATSKPSVASSSGDANVPVGDSEGYDYPKPGKPGPSPLSTRPTPAVTGSTTPAAPSRPDSGDDSEGYDYPKPNVPSPVAAGVTSTTPGSSSPASGLNQPNGDGYSYPNPANQGQPSVASRPTSSTPGSSTSELSDALDNPEADSEGYNYPRPGSEGGPSPAGPGRPASTTPGSSFSAGPGELENPDSEGYGYPNPANQDRPSSAEPSSPASGPSSAAPSRPMPTVSTGSVPMSTAEGNAEPLGEDFDGYDYSKPAQPFPSGSSGATPSETEKGYDYPKPSKRL